MTSQPVPRLDPRFSSPNAEPVQWEDVEKLIEEAEIFWLSTVREDGRPHVAPLPAIWLEDALHFCTGVGEQKTRNLMHEPRCALTTGCNRFGSGMDLVVEGSAGRVEDRELLERLAARWLSKLDWRFEVVEGGFNDPLAPADPPGGATAWVFRLAPAKVLAFGKGEPFSQTRFLFLPA